MSRRELIALALGSVLTAGCASEPAPAPAEEATGVPTYRVDTSWPQLPNNWVLGDPSSIAVDSRDHVWVLHRPRTVPKELLERAAPPVLEFDADGNFVQGWGGPSDAYEWPDTEHGIFVDETGHVWIGGNNPTAQVRLTDRSDDMLLKFTTQGDFVLQIGKRDQSGGNADTQNLMRPADVAVHNGELFVADGYGNRRVIVFDANTGEYKRMWGAFGNQPLDPEPATPGAPPAARVDEGPGPDQFGIVHGLKVSNDGYVYVADRGNRRIQVFTLDGKYVTQAFVNRSGESGNTAAGLAFSPDPEQRLLYVADFGNGQIVILDRTTLEPVGSVGTRGEEPGNFRNPHHIAVDSRGNLYTAEVNPGSRVQRFEFTGMAPVSTSTTQ